MESYIFLRGLRHVDHTVFCVTDGQKFYWDPVFTNTRMPYSSGQQVKRSILDSIGNELNQERSPVSFIWKAPGLEEGEVLSLCDPQYYDQILGGWMHTAQKDDSGKKDRTLKRRSPFSISAMRPLHPLLGGIASENMTFDRSDRPNVSNKIIVRDSNGKQLTNEEIDELISGTDRSLLRKWLRPGNRASGLFIYDIAIDLRTLFCVSTNQLEPEITKEKIEELKDKGWVEAQNAFGHCLVMPKEQREIAIPSIAKALLNWRITSNQARTFSLMETLAVAISNDANQLAGAIRAKLIGDSEKPKAKPIIDETTRADVFVTLPCAAYIETEIESADALEKAEQALIEKMKAFDYENQLKGKEEVK